MCVGFIVRQSELLAILTHLRPRTGSPASQHSRETCPLNPYTVFTIDLVSDLRGKEMKGGRKIRKKAGK